MLVPQLTRNSYGTFTKHLLKHGVLSAKCQLHINALNSHPVRQVLLLFLFNRCKVKSFAQGHAAKWQRQDLNPGSLQSNNNILTKILTNNNHLTTGLEDSSSRGCMNGRVEQYKVQWQGLQMGILLVCTPVLCPWANQLLLASDIMTGIIIGASKNSLRIICKALFTQQALCASSFLSAQRRLRHQTARM